VIVDFLNGDPDQPIITGRWLRNRKSQKVCGTKAGILTVLHFLEKVIGKAF
jgi:uncharacterized protein involved in type VI secretion and phage assembly